jgi:2'-5' RNA ligase
VPHITLYHGNLSADALAEAVRLLSQWDFTWRLRLDNLTLLVGDGETPQHHVQYQYPLTGTR